MSKYYVYTDSNNAVVGVAEKPVLSFSFPTTMHVFTGTIPPSPHDYDFVNGQFVANTSRQISSVRSHKIAEITSAFEQAMGALVAGYPEREISSWPQQEKEARAWVDYLASTAAGTTAPTPPATPMLDALATARGVTKDVIAQKIVQKADQYAAAAGALIGKRQALEDQINAATTVVELEAITW